MCSYSYMKQSTHGNPSISNYCKIICFHPPSASASCGISLIEKWALIGITYLGSSVAIRCSNPTFSLNWKRSHVLCNKSCYWFGNVMCSGGVEREWTLGFSVDCVEFNKSCCISPWPTLEFDSIVSSTVTVRINSLQIRHWFLCNMMYVCSVRFLMHLQPAIFTGTGASRFSGLQDFFNIVLILSSEILCFMLECTMSARTFEIFRPVVFLCTWTNNRSVMLRHPHSR